MYYDVAVLISCREFLRAEPLLLLLVMKVGETGTEEEEEESGYSEGWMDLKEGGWLGVSCFMYFTGPHPAFLPPCRSCRSRGRRIPRRLIPQRVAANGAGGSAVLLERRQWWVGAICWRWGWCCLGNGSPLEWGLGWHVSPPPPLQGCETNIFP